jgi:MFS family permease
VSERLPRQFWFLWLALVVNRTGKMVVPFLTLFLTRERGLGAFEVGLILAMNGVGYLLAGLMSGPMAERLGRKGLMIFALSLSACVLALFTVVEHPLLLALLALALSSVGGMYGPAANALVGDNVPPSQRYRAFALLHWAANLGFAVAPVVAGLLAELSYLWLFVGEALITLGCALLVAVTVEDRPQPQAPAAQASAEAPQSGSPMADRGFLAYCVLATGLGIVFAQVDVALPLYLGQAGIGEAEYGRIIGMNGLMIVFVQPLMSRVVPKLPAALTLVAGPLLTGIGFGMHGLGLDWRIQVAAVAVWSLGEVIWSPISQAIVSNFAGSGDRVRYYGAYNVFVGISVLAGPVLGAAALGLLGAWFWPVCVAVGAAVALGFLGLGVSERVYDRPQVST